MSQYLVKTQDITKVTAAKNPQEVHPGFYLVEADDLAALTAQVESIEPAHDEVKLTFQVAPVAGSADFVGLPADHEWARLRVVSRVHPLQTVFNRADCTYVRTPELFIVDTGVNFSHDEFVGVASTNDFYKVPALSSFRDDLGHGTAVASLACGKNIGVEQSVSLQNVKIAGDGHTTTNLELGNALFSILKHHADTPTVPKVVNCSWNVPKSAFFDDIFKAMLSAGICVVAAAGNTGIDVTDTTPAGLVDVITVAASDKDDVSAGFNNFSKPDMAITTNAGLTVDIFAPGVDIVVAKYDGNDHYFSGSGTSFAAPLVTGAACIIMSMLESVFGSDVRQIMIDTATKGALLLDASKFTAEQNNLLFLLNTDEAAQFKDLTFFVDTLSVTNPTISSDVNRVMAWKNYESVSGESPAFSIVYPDDATKAALENNITISNDGTFVITNPTLTWAADENLRLMDFKVAVTFKNVSYTSPKIVFFVVNPAQKADVSGEISSALESMNAQTLFAAWASKTLK